MNCLEKSSFFKGNSLIGLQDTVNCIDVQVFFESQ